MIDISEKINKQVISKQMYDLANILYFKVHVIIGYIPGKYLWGNIADLTTNCIMYEKTREHK